MSFEASEDLETILLNIKSDNIDGARELFHAYVLSRMRDFHYQDALRVLIDDFVQSQVSEFEKDKQLMAADFHAKKKSEKRSVDIKALLEILHRELEVKLDRLRFDIKTKDCWGNHTETLIDFLRSEFREFMVDRATLIARSR